MPLRLLLAATLSLLTLQAIAGAAVQTFDANFDLTVGANYDAGAGVTPSDTIDVLFDTAYPTAAGIFQLGSGATATSMAAQSINNISAFAITIGNNSSNATASNATLTLGNPTAQANGVSGAAATDLIYVGGTGNLTLQGSNLRNGQATGTGTMAVALAQSGNVNVVNAASTLTISSNITGAFALTKIGAGSLSLTGATKSFSSLTILGGRVSADGSSTLGTGTITLGDSTGSATLNIVQSISNAIVVAAGTASQTLEADFNSVTYSGDITLNNDVLLTMSRSANRFLTFSGQITGNKTITALSVNNSSENGVSLTGNNSSSFTGNIVVTRGILGFNAGSLGTVGTITLASNSPGLAWLSTNTEDVSNRLQALSGSTAAIIDTRNNNITFSTTNGLAGTSTSSYSKLNLHGSGGGVASTGSLTLAAANTAFLGTYNTAANGATILAHTDALRNATLAVGTGPTQTVGGVMFSSTVGSHAFSIGNLTGAGNVWLSDDAANDIALTTGYNNTSGTYSGTLTGGNALTKVGTGSWTLSGVATVAGPVAVRGGTMTLSSVATLANATSYSARTGTLAVDNNTTLTPARLSLVNLTLQGGFYSQTGRGAATSSTSEAVSALILGSGANGVTLTQSSQTGTNNTLTVASVTRNNRATGQFRGSQGLGTLAAGSNGATFFTNNIAPTADLIGGGGSFASGTASNISILPYLVGDTGAGSTSPTFVSYDTTNNSYRVLKTGEYLANFTGATGSSNIRFATNSTGPSVTAGTYNSLSILEGTPTGAVTATLTGTVTLNSGALLLGRTGGTARATTLTGGLLQFAAANVAGTSSTEGMITNIIGADLRIATQISSVGGVTFSTYANTSASTITLDSASNNWTGTTTINGNVTVNAVSKLGNSATVNVGAGGVLTLVGNTTVDDSAALSVLDGGSLNLAFADGQLETVSQLTLGSTVFTTGTFTLANNWGGYGNAAGSFFAGSTGGLLVAVPEPASLSLVGLGIAGLLKRRRRA